MRQHFVFLILLFIATAAARNVSPFFNRKEGGIQADIDAQGNIQKLKYLKESAIRRRLGVGSHPNLPGGGGYAVSEEDVVDGGAGDGDHEAGGEGSGSGKRFIGKHAKSGKGKGGGGKLPKKTSTSGKGKDGKGKGGKGKSGKGKGGKGKGGKGKDSSGDDSGGEDSWEDGMDGEIPPEPCTCTNDYCDCDDGLATEYEFVMVSLLSFLRLSTTSVTDSRTDFSFLSSPL